MVLFNKLCPFFHNKRMKIQQQKIEKLKSIAERKEIILESYIKRIDETAKEMKDLYARIEQSESIRNVAVNLAPTWFWVKKVRTDEDGNMYSAEYLEANDLFMEEFFTDIPADEIIGSCDADLAGKMNEIHKSKHGINSFTFGQELCADSDRVVIETGRRSTFTENGKINGVMRYVIVHKALLYDNEGNPIATVGTGRDITEDYLTLQNLKTLDNKDDIITCISQFLEKYHFLPNQSIEMLQE